MKVSVAVAAWISAICACGPLSASAAVCSSLNGPYCTGILSDFAVPPAHAATNLDISEQNVKENDLAKKLKIENVLKQYELEALSSQLEDRSDQQLLLDELNELLDETAALIADLVADDGESPVIGSFAFSNEGDTYDLLETMNGKEMKDFFELAYDEVIRSWEDALEDMSLEISQGLRNSLDELKQIKDIYAYEFQHLDDISMDNIRHRFENHRLMEVQRVFERLVVAKNPQERKTAFEAAVYLFQLCDEYAEDEPEKDAEGESNNADSLSFSESSDDRTGDTAAHAAR